MTHSADAHGRALKIFSSALALSGTERAAFLDDACAGDEELRAEVDSLLEHDAQVLDGSQEEGSQGQRAVLGALLAEHREADYDCSVGDVIGPYKLLEPVGEGGFGVVWRAEQSQPVRRTVALKVLKAGMSTKEVLARFDAESNALSLMSHENIARVYDAGATPSGRPYFVMEYLEGVAITDFCDSEGLSLGARLQLFVDVCAAVQHAHQKGVIHRDLKPTNILVVTQDGKPVPKIIDFGIAKAISQPLSEKTVFTAQGQLMGTLEYMSPEQAEMSAVGVDSTTDVYSLGVILYELLTGMLPFDSEVLRSRGLGEIFRVLREEEPNLPSARVSTLGDKQVAIGKHRGTDLRRLKKDLAGDLDWIVMRAMEKQCARRYASVSELAADVQRHLEDEPVLAGPPGRGYRLQKFVRRHRLGLGFAGVVSLLLVSGIIGTTLGMLDANRARESAQSESIAAEEARAVAVLAREHADEQTAEALSQFERAEENLKKAKEEAGRASAVTGFLLNTLGLADPDISELPEMTMVAALGAAAAEVSEVFADYPEDEARLRQVLGRAYFTLGRPDLADPQLRRALYLRKEELDSDAIEVLETLRVLWQVANRLGHPSWQNLAMEAHELSHEIIERSEPELSRRFGALDAMALRYPVDEEAVREEWDELCALALERIRPGDPASDELMIEMFSAPLWMGWRSRKLSAAEMIEEALAFSSMSLSNSRTRLLNEQALHLRMRAGDFVGARVRAEERMERLGEMLGTDHWYLVIYRYIIGSCLMEEGNVVEAEGILEQCLTDIEGSPSPSLWEALVVHQDLAELHERAGRPELAAPHRKGLVDQALSLSDGYHWPVLQKMLSPEYAEVMEAIDQFDSMIRRRSRRGPLPESCEPELAQLAHEALEARRRCCPDEDPVAWLLAWQLAMRAELPIASAVDSPGELLLIEAHRLGGLHRTSQPWARLHVAGMLYEYSVSRDRSELARRVGRDIDELVAMDLPSPHEWAEYTGLNGANTIRLLAKFPGLAPATYDFCAQFALEVLPRLPDRPAALGPIGMALFRVGRYEEAIDHLLQSDRLARRKQPAGRAADLIFLAMAHHELGKAGEAINYLQGARAAMREEAGSGTRENQSMLAEAEALLAVGR